MKNIKEILERIEIQEVIKTNDYVRIILNDPTTGVKATVSSSYATELFVEFSKEIEKINYVKDGEEIDLYTLPDKDQEEYLSCLAYVVKLLRKLDFAIEEFPTVHIAISKPFKGWKED